MLYEYSEYDIYRWTSDDLTYGLMLLFAIVLICALIFLIKKKMCKVAVVPSAKNGYDKAQDLEMVQRVFSESLADLDRHAKGFALYEALLKVSLDAEIQKQLYKEFGEYYTEPSLASVPAAEKYEDIFYGTEFQKLVKDYLKNHEIEPSESQFVLFNQMGELTLKMHRNEMEELVKRKYEERNN